MAQAIQAPLPPHFYFGDDGRLQYDFKAARQQKLGASQADGSDLELGQMSIFDKELPETPLDVPDSPDSQLTESSLDSRETPEIPDTSEFDVPSFNSSFQLSGLLISNPQTQNADVPSQDDDAPTEPPAAKLRISIPKERAAPTAQRPKTWFPGLQFLEEDEECRSATSVSGSSSPVTQNADVRKSVAGTSISSFASLARRSWLSRGSSSKGSLTPTASPALKDSTAKYVTDDEDEKQDAPSTVGSNKRFSRASAYFGKAMTKQSSLFKVHEYADSDDSCASSAASLRQPGAESVDSHRWSDSNMTTPVTDDASSADIPLARDALWTVFKKLNIEAQCFPAKTVSQKISQLQTQLLPFLRSTASHPSTKTLIADEVDQRATILDRWWSAVLDMLDEDTQPPIPGVDRPVVLEAATMLMMRPEWRKATSYFQPLSERSPTEKVRARGWANSINSTAEVTFEQMMLAESAEHNVRTMFISNLIRQMGFVVEKMSLRHAPLTLVNFAGKTCAYAFFFAPGVADVLVRLWSLTPDLIRRVADEMNLPRRDTGESDDIVALFPPKLGVFGWTTPRTLWNTIKQVPKMSVMIARIPWTGAWVSRWKGRDTDLFFIFCKYYHILCEQFMPTELPLIEKARSPAFVLVQAQLLNILDSTVHRQAVMASPMFVDSIHGVDDASAMTLPMATSNLMKGMAENRMVALLKDILNDDASENLTARHTFAEAFAALLKAATLRTSKYNNAACLALCDLLEEVFTIYDNFEVATSSPAYNDWNFWFDVFQKVMSSLNTISEVRMLAFLYSIWNIATRDPARKETLCAKWLLTEETFNSLFNNWCPMVRAYYHRLLCWRICRDEKNSDEESADDVDREVYALASQRLKTVWSHYLFLKNNAAEQGRAGPSTIAMSPTLGKRFIIIRQEVNSPQLGVVMGFDTFARTNPAPSGQLTSSASFDAATTPKPEMKKRWSLFGKVLSRSGANSPELTAIDLPRNKSFDDSRRPSEIIRHRHSVQVPPSASKSSKLSSSGLSSELDLSAPSPKPDTQRFVFKFVLGWQQQQTMSQRERNLFTPQLPGPAQMRIGGDSSTPIIRPKARDVLRTMSVNGLSGLVNNAKNAGVLEERLQQLTYSSTPLNSLSVTSSRQPSRPGSSYSNRSGGASDKTETAAMLNYVSGQLHDAPTAPLKPAGVFAQNAVYSGQALAEWAQVVSECNSFISRRCEEGIDRLADVEVPQLGVEGFRKLAG